MAEVVWSEPALQDLDQIADYIALDDPIAANKLVRAVFEKVDLLETFPEMCEAGVVYVIYVMRSERNMNLKDIKDRDA